MADDLTPIVIADAVTEMVNSLGILDVTAVRRHVPDWDLGDGDLQTMEVTVVADGETESTQIARGLWLNKQVVDIGLQKKVKAADADAVDRMIATATEIRDAMREQSLPHDERADITDARLEPPYDDNHLRQGIYTGIVRLEVTYYTKKE